MLPACSPAAMTSTRVISVVFIRFITWDDLSVEKLKSPLVMVTMNCALLLCVGVVSIPHTHFYTKYTVDIC